MKVIKISSPWFDEFYHLNLPVNRMVGGFTFEINNDCDYCDYWIVWGGLKNNQKAHCEKNNVFFLTGEVIPEITYKQLFLNQFSAVITCRNDINHHRIIKSDSDIGSGAWHFCHMDYEKLIDMRPPVKTKTLSVVSSDLTVLSGHKKRYAFVNKLIGHFKDKIDVFGRGFNYIEDKYDGISQYKYSIAIENSTINSYFTEKIYECFLAYTMPIYYGCPNINDYFNKDSILAIDLENYQGAITRIEQAIDEDIYESRLTYIKNSRNSYFDKYHVYTALAKLLGNLPALERSKKRQINLRPEQDFIPFAKKVFLKSFYFFTGE